MSSGASSAILIFPSGVDSFSTKIDRGVVVSGESHIIPSAPFQFYLSYVPLLNSPTTTSIPGYTEVSGVPATGQFQTIYSGNNAGLLTFNSANSGTTVGISYTTYGDI